MSMLAGSWQLAERATSFELSTATVEATTPNVQLTGSWQLAKRATKYELIVAIG
jgi:hypothetical protein